jgi:hypothetical protein
MARGPVPAGPPAPRRQPRRTARRPREGRALRWVRKRPVLAAAFAYACLALLFVSPALPPGRTLSSSDLLWFSTPYSSTRPADLTRPSTEEAFDQPLLLEPWLRYTRTHGLNAPLWDPYQMGGIPLLGTTNGTPYSPLYLPAYVLPFWRGLIFDAALKLFVAAFGTFVLARALGVRFAGALLAGVVYAYSLQMVIWLPWPQTSVWAWIPWMLLLTDRLVRRPEPLAVAGLGTVIGAQFIAGHPETSFHALVFTAAFFLLRLLVLHGRAGLKPRVLLPRAGAVAGAAAVGAAVGAIWLVPFDELLRNSYETSLRGTLHPKLGLYALGNLFVPALWGRGTGSVTGTILTLNRYIYVGALPIVLAGVALLTRRSGQRIALAGFGAVSLAVALGVPGLFDLVQHLPGFKQADDRRLILVFQLAVALLAGFGLDDLMERMRRGTTRSLRGPVLIAAGFVLLSVFWVFAVHPSARSFSSDLLAHWGFKAPPATELIGIALFAGGAALLVLARLRRRVRAPAFAALALALVVADLFRAGMGLNPAVPVAHAAPPATPAIRYLQSRRPARFVGLGNGPIPSLGAQTFPYATGLRYGIYDARGYNAPLVGRFQRYWSRLVSPTKYLFAVVPTLSEKRLRALDLFSVADIVQSRADSPPLDLPGLSLAYARPDAQIYSNAGALPRAFVVGAQQIATGPDAALEAVADDSFDPRRFAVTEADLPGLTGASSAPPGFTGTARLSSYEADRVVVQASASRPSLLVLTDVAYPGWKASVDGKDAPVEHADYVLRGVVIPAGTHLVTFRYEPSTWSLGRDVSVAGGASVLVLSLAGLWLWRRRRRLAT